MRPYLRKICFGFWWEQGQGILLSIQELYGQFFLKEKYFLKDFKTKSKEEKVKQAGKRRDRALC